MIDIEKLVFSITEKYPYQKLLKHLSFLDIPTARGKANIYESLIKGFKEGTIDDSVETFLEEQYLEIIKYGDKAVKYFLLSDNDTSKIIDFANDITIEESTFSESYPFLVDKNALNKIDTNIYLCDVEMNDDRITFCYVSKRFQKNKIELTQRLNQHKEDLDDINISSFHEIYGYRLEYDQCFDYVILNKKDNRLEIHTDISNTLINRDSIKDNFESLIQIIQHEYDIEDFQKKYDPCNLFDNVKRLYETKTEGKVGELGFITDTSSVKNSKMRRGSEDLRDEIFHVGGTEKLVEKSLGWDAFKIAIIYNAEKSGKIELYLPGSVRTLNHGNRKIEEVWLKGCICEKDFQFLKSKIVLEIED